MSTAITPPTPENVAEFLSSADNDYHDGYDWWPSIVAKGNVVEIGITPVGQDYETKLSEVHFRAVVVEGDAVPLILDPERYTAEVISRVEWLVVALAHAPREDYPIHLAQFRGALLELAEAQTGGAS